MKEADKVKQAQAIRTLRDMLTENLAAEIERAEVFAKMHRIKYNAYVKEGFTPEQALFLCRDT